MNKAFFDKFAKKKRPSILMILIQLLAFAVVIQYKIPYLKQGKKNKNKSTCCPKNLVYRVSKESF